MTNDDAEGHVIRLTVLLGKHYSDSLQLLGKCHFLLGTAGCVNSMAHARTRNGAVGCGHPSSPNTKYGLLI